MDECNFKYKLEEGLLKKSISYTCGLTRAASPMSVVSWNCPGEENCILFQIYKNIGK